MLNRQKSIRAVSTFPVGKLRRAEFIFDDSSGVAVVDNFLECPSNHRGNVNTPIVTVLFRQVNVREESYICPLPQ